jgi:protein-S-isoprenylcysteine O-methyltransferase Ste14
MNDTIFRILAAVIFLVGARISSYYRRKADRETGEKVSLKDEGLAMTVALRTLGIAVWLAVLAFMINPAWIAWSRLDLPEGLRWVGVAMGVLGDALAYWTLSSLGNNVSSTVRTRTQATLVMEGPYRYVRHPLYLMGLIAYLGFALLSESWFIALVSLVLFVLIVIRTAKEEARLLEKFGEDYRSYMQRTGRFFPRLG